jgi:hypothetical protein
MEYTGVGYPQVERSAFLKLSFWELTFQLFRLVAALTLVAFLTISLIVVSYFWGDLLLSCLLPSPHA